MLQHICRFLEQQQCICCAALPPLQLCQGYQGLHILCMLLAHCTPLDLHMHLESCHTSHRTVTVLSDNAGTICAGIWGPAVLTVLHGVDLTSLWRLALQACLPTSNSSSQDTLASMYISKAVLHPRTAGIAFGMACLVLVGNSFSTCS